MPFFNHYFFFRALLEMLILPSHDLSVYIYLFFTFFLIFGIFFSGFISRFCLCLIQVLDLKYMETDALNDIC